MTPVRDFADVPSIGVLDKVRTAHRLDPYYDGLWGLGGTASWTTWSLAHHQVTTGLADKPSWLDFDQEEAWRLLTNPVTLRKRLDMLATLCSWRTITTQQLAAFTAQDDLVGFSAPVRHAFTSQVLDIGLFSSGLMRTSLASQATLVRPARTKVVTRDLLPLLTYPETVSMTGGMPWRSGGQYDRHNVLAAELSLRIAEWSPQVACVLGERFATADMLVGSGAGAPPRTKREAYELSKGADAVWVRTDGLRIALEMTASVNSEFVDKVRSWAQILSRHTYARSGLVVLFVAAPHPDRAGATPSALNAAMRKAIMRVAAEFNSDSLDSPARRMAVATWAEYFPAPGKVSRDFLTLAAHRPVGGKGQPWVKLSYLDDFDTPFDPMTTGMRDVIDAASTLGSVPMWLRRRAAAVDLHQSSMLRLTGADTVPVAYPKDPRRQIGFDPDNFRGTGALATLPDRLLSTPRAPSAAERAQAG